MNKYTVEERSRKYDELYDEADAFLKEHTPCSKCKGCTLFGGSDPSCCKGCPFLGPTGCTTKCLACKLWLCEYGVLSPAQRHQLWRMQDEAEEYNIHYARSTMEEALSAATKRSTWWFARKNNRGC